MTVRRLAVAMLVLTSVGGCGQAVAPSPPSAAGPAPDASIGSVKAPSGLDYNGVGCGRGCVDRLVFSQPGALATDSGAAAVSASKGDLFAPPGVGSDQGGLPMDGGKAAASASNGDLFAPPGMNADPGGANGGLSFGSSATRGNEAPEVDTPAGSQDDAQGARRKSGRPLMSIEQASGAFTSAPVLTPLHSAPTAPQAARSAPASGAKPAQGFFTPG